MITKSDWQAAGRQLMAEDRRNLEPPTSEEMLAYTRGELSPEAEARVRERLVCHPDLLRTLTEPFPTEGAEPGHADYVADDEYARHWNAMRKRMGRGGEFQANGRVLQFWRTVSAIAAALALVAGIGWWRTVLTVVQPRLVGDAQTLLPDGRRGPSTDVPVMEIQGDSITLMPSLIGPLDFAQYRLELVRVATNRTVWRSGVVRPREQGAFEILIPKRLIKPGEYRIVIHGVATRGEQQVATYSVRFE